MKCIEYFYNEKEAMNFFESVRIDLDPEILKTIDEDCNENVWIVCYNPPRLK